MAKFLVRWHGTCGFAGCDMYEEEEFEAASVDDLHATHALQQIADIMVQEYYQLEAWYDIEEIED